MGGKNIETLQNGLKQEEKNNTILSERAHSYLTCYMFPEAEESCDFKTLKIEIGQRQP